MSNPSFQSFRTYLQQREKSDDVVHEVLKHELGATLNRQRLTGQLEGMHSLNTSQLSVLVGSHGNIHAGHSMTHALLVSAMIDDDMELIDHAVQNEIMPAEWGWLSWAREFNGNAQVLYDHLNDLSYIRERCGAACLATRHNTAAINLQVLHLFLDESTSKTYHLLLQRVLRGPHKSEIAEAELTILAKNLDILFSADTDRVLASLVDASSLDQPELALLPFKDAAGEWTQVAVARRHLENGRPQVALNMVKDLRFLSPAYEQAIAIAALAALECKDFNMTELYCHSIEDTDLRLKIVTRLAQVRGDVAAEVDALTTLYQRQPHDAQVFVQLIRVLARINQTELAKALCLQAQEQFFDDPTVQSMIQHFIKK